MIVIGAGASGLATAKQLHNFGIKVKIRSTAMLCDFPSDVLSNINRVSINSELGVTSLCYIAPIAKVLSTPLNFLHPFSLLSR